jgi:thiamine biosynthesis protein ThiI
MKFIVKFFPEITIKSKPVRRQFVSRLRDNLKIRFKEIDSSIVVERDWDKLTVIVPDLPGAQMEDVLDVLKYSPGIAYFLEVVDYPLGDMHDIFEKTLALYQEQLQGKTFSVRCKRAGKHDFASGDVERYVGGGLNQHIDSASVKLREPDVTVRLEIRDQILFIVKRKYKGLGGFPLGALDPVLSLISGGFDSTVSSYLTMKRGMRTHFCFFNLGGRAHEVAVKEVALYLWMKYGASSRVKFVVVPFEEVVGEILTQVENSQMGVILKRMMLRAASKVAEELEVQALVTGECVAQVSSQTLTNLTVIDRVTDTLVLRPLITSDKTEIIDIAREIGTEDFAANIPEYCGVISVKPTTKAKLPKIEHEEGRFNFAVLDKAVAEARYVNIDEVANEELAVADVEVMSVPVHGSVIIDVRHPDEQDRKPFSVPGQVVISIPFYQLPSKFAELDKDTPYLLYCDKGVMSKLHASHLVEDGHKNVGVYRPA